MKYLLQFIAVFFISMCSSVFANDIPRIYVREDCPHCANVEAFILENNLQDSVEIIDVMKDEKKALELAEWFDKLSVKDEQRGVPFMVADEEKYFSGDLPIVEYLGNKYGIDIKSETEYQVSTSDTVFLVIGGLVVFAVFGYGVYSMFSKRV